MLDLGFQVLVMGVQSVCPECVVDWTGRIIRDDKRGHIQQPHPKILDRLSLDQDSWKELTTQFEEHFQSWVSSEHINKALSRSLNNVPPASVHFLE